MAVVEVQRALLDDDCSSSLVSEDFIDDFSKVASHCWPLLASLLSFSTAEIDQIKRGVTGVPSVKAAAMLNSWREKTSPTYLTLREKVSISVSFKTRDVPHCWRKMQFYYYSGLSRNQLLQSGLVVKSYSVILLETRELELCSSEYFHAT